MNLPKLFTAQEQTQEPRRVLGLLLTADHLQALLMELRDQETNLLQKSRVLEYSDADSALKKADEAFQDLGPDSESINQTIFCLESAWVKDGDIVETKRPLVKKITTDLSLEALGFIVISEALAHYFIQENSLFSGLLFLFNAEQVHVSLVSQGKIQGVEVVGRSDNSVADIEEALARIAAKHTSHQQSLPPKMILASFTLTEDELHKQHQQLLEYSWTDQNVFMQAPMIEVVGAERFISLIAAEAARAVALSHGLPAPQIPKARPVPSTNELPQGQTTSAKREPESEVIPVELDEALQPVSPSASASSDDVERAVDVAATAFGIPIAADKLPASDHPHRAQASDFSDEFAEVSDHTEVSKTSSKKKFSVLHHMTKPYQGKKKPVHFALLGLIAGVLALLGIAVFGVFFMTSARVEVTLQRLPVSKEIEIMVDPNATSSDPEKRVLAAQQATKTVSDESTIQTTGVKLVGDKAKGKVKVLNGTESPKTFIAGTTLTADGKSFTLDQDVTVASASTKVTNGGKQTTFGETEASVTAKDIGEESNLSKDKELTIDKFSLDTFSAIVVEAFTGGASREVRVVAAKDKNEVLADLRAELLTKAAQEFKDESGSGTYYLPNPTVLKEIPTFSAKEGEETDELTLSLELHVQALSYTAADLQPIAKAVLSSEVPEGYELAGEDPQILSAPDETKSASGSAKAVTTALLVSITTDAFPVLQTDNLAQQIVGKPLDQAQQLLREADTIADASITITPAIAQPLVKTLPKDQKRITVILKRE